MKMPANYKTTLAGVLTALGLSGFATQVGSREGQLSLFAAALGALLKGIFAEDASKK